MDGRDRIEQVLEEVRPYLRADGGDVEFVDYDEDGGIVQLRLVGVCGACPISMVTLKQGIERRIVTALPTVKEVLAV